MCCLFLDLVVSPDHIALDPTKVNIVTNWPVPMHRKQLLRFLGFANFY